ncbi:hypothetical protein [Fulvimonas soli]|jgi:hypothetical protein|uniref:DUF1579 domain-containing protein n=1 Tax=Fulvimonas soli TaxID=155197 RepID=A0A316I8B1_9GAMM|nr:hypothetical protein [Fulvimonas soli]PWK83504.1 hypothetical protein C7456_11337 [Fulvimonas soli]TNY25518.1 hypothetical protein BV497_13570 [Fulvimonas soli]
MPRHLPAAVLATLLSVAAAPTHAAGATDKPAACSAPAHRQFDFWLGDWDAYRVGEPGKPPAARNHVTRMLDGCARREVYRRADGYVGESFTTYDEARRVWHQSWVTNRGELAVLEGTRQADGGIVLQGPSSDAGGVVRVRAAWKPQGDGVRETAEQSRDGGRTWTPAFDLLFRPHR